MHIGKFALLGMVAGLAGSAVPVSAATPPAIRLSAYNQVPACVTPARLMHFLRERNPQLDHRYDELALLYRKHGEAWHVRWDYAFFQMIIETNHLLYRTGSGKWGDVNPRQNNFAGIGTTGGGVPGDGYKDVSTGVLAQIQHLVAYSGERLDNPVANRTQIAQDDIIARSARLRRTVTFADLSGRWAVDRRYFRSIEWVADRFRAIHCTGHSPVPDDPPPAPPPRLVRAPYQASRAHHAAVQPPAGPIEAKRVKAAAVAPVATPAIERAATQPCKVQTASFVGQTGARRTVLIRSESGSETHITALDVLDGFENSMAASFIKSRAPGGSVIGSFELNDAAMSKAREFCPG